MLKYAITITQSHGTRALGVGKAQRSQDRNEGSTNTENINQHR